MAGFKPIKQSRASEEVLKQLKGAIITGEYPSGSKLPSERELTEQFQVSRGVIREAIRALELTGFVVIRQGNTGGAFITDLSLKNVSGAFLDLFLSNKISIPELGHVRWYIEPEVARLAARHHTAADRERLLAAQQAEFKDSPDYPHRIDKMQRIHALLASMCGNHFFEAIAKSMLQLTHEVVMAVEPNHDALHMPGEHSGIIEAVLARDGDKAAELMRQHQNVFKSRLVEMEKAYRQKVIERKAV